MCISTVLIHIFSHRVRASYNKELKTSSDTQLAIGSGEFQTVFLTHPVSSITLATNDAVGATSMTISLWSPIPLQLSL